MPKRRWKIDRFEGGLNNVSDPRDINDNELAFAQNIAVDKFGQIRGKAVFNQALANLGYGPVLDDDNDNIEPGSGLFVFQADYQGGTGAAEMIDLVDGLPSANTSDTLVLVANSKTAGTTTAVEIYSTAHNSFTYGLSGSTANNGFVVNPSARDRAINFYAADGAVRAADMIDDTGGGASKVMWLGYIKRDRFQNNAGSDTEASDSWDGWFICDSGLSAPTDGDLNFREHTTLDHPTYLTDTDGYLVTIATTANEGSWAANRYNVGITWVYDGAQESLVHTISTVGELAVAASDSLTVRINMYNNSDANAHQLPNTTTNHARLNPRITGGRVYVQESGDGTDAHDATGGAWQFLCGFDAGGSGIATNLSATGGSGYTVASRNATAVVGQWTSNGTDEAYIDATVKEPSLETYDSINGYSPFVHGISFDDSGMGYFDSVVANRRAFVCNVTNLNEYNVKRRHGDRILYSEANRFDTFPSDNYIDIGVNDGDEFRAIYSYADRLLAFKRNKLYIINIGSGADTAWFLESEHEHMGVNHPCSVTKTDYGIAFANHTGAFLYDGRKITELSDKIVKEDTSGDLDDWYTFITLNANPTGNEFPVVGFEKRSKKLIVVASPGAGAESGSSFVYDFRTRSWVYNQDMFIDTNEHTNFAHDAKGNLITGLVVSGNNDTSIFTWADGGGILGADNSTPIVQTKDIDFGDISRVKKVYNIYVTYKSSGDRASPLEYAVDGKANFTDTTTGAGTITTGAGDSDTIPLATAWDVAKFSLASPISCQSLQLQFNPPGVGTFEINDIAIEYRTIYKRVS